MSAVSRVALPKRWEDHRIRELETRIAERDHHIRQLERLLLAANEENEQLRLELAGE